MNDRKFDTLPTRIREHLGPEEPYPRYEAPRWAFDLAVWCRRKRLVLGYLLTSAGVGVCLALAVVAAVGGLR